MGKGTAQTRFIFSAPPDSLETSLNISKSVGQTELQKLVDLAKESALMGQGEEVRTTEQSALGWQICWLLLSRRERKDYGISLWLANQEAETGLVENSS